MCSSISQETIKNSLYFEIWQEIINNTQRYDNIIKAYWYINIRDPINFNIIITLYKMYWCHCTQNEMPYLQFSNAISYAIHNI